MDILYSDSLSGNVAFDCLMFMPEISNRMVFVNGKHPWSLCVGGGGEGEGEGVGTPPSLDKLSV